MTRCCCGQMSIPDGQLAVTDTDTVHRAGGPCYVDEGTECGRVAWLATIGARATVCCTLPYAHDGNHYDAILGVYWGDDD